MTITESDAVDVKPDPITEGEEQDDASLSSSSGSLVSVENSLFGNGQTQSQRNQHRKQGNGKNQTKSSAESVSCVSADNSTAKITEKDLEPYLDLRNDFPD